MFLQHDVPPVSKFFYIWFSSRSLLQASGCQAPCPSCLSVTCYEKFYISLRDCRSNSCLSHVLGWFGEDTCLTAMEGVFQAASSAYCPVPFTDNIGDGLTVVREGGRCIGPSTIAPSQFCLDRVVIKLYTKPKWRRRMAFLPHWTLPY